VYSPDGKYIASSGDNTVRIWDSTSGDIVRIIDLSESNYYSGSSVWIMAVAFSPDGKYIVSGSLRYSIQKRETNSGLLLQTFLGHESDVTCIAYSPDGKYIVSGSIDHTVRIWNSTSGENIHILRGHASSIFSVAYSPDGKHIVSSSAGYDGFQGKRDTEDGEGLVSGVSVWESKSGKPVDVLKTKQYLWAARFSPDGKYIAQDYGIWEMSSGNQTNPSFSYTLVMRYGRLSQETIYIHLIKILNGFGQKIERKSLALEAFNSKMKENISRLG
jgi:WD40 repeat protein